mmetsp:Transcript_20914/g.35008  ORF Transcript_20914/g.35008 Transcript_20914/m.35008 type:complete len:104 (+) Transcript_20914:92-403(+)
MSKSGEVKELKGNKAYDSAFIAMIVLSMGASSLLVHQFSTPEGGNAATKPYNTFEEFYPHYISEHSDQTCRRLHFVGKLAWYVNFKLSTMPLIGSSTSQLTTI